MADTWTWKENPDIRDRISRVRVNSVLRSWGKESPSVRNWLYCSLVSASSCQNWHTLPIPVPDHIKALIADEDHSGEIYFIRMDDTVHVMI